MQTYSVESFEGKDAIDYERARVLVDLHGDNFSELENRNADEAISITESLLLRVPQEKVKLYMLLADAYRTKAMCFMVKKSPEKVRWFKMEEDILAKAMEIQPKNVGLMTRYAFSLDSERRIPILEKAIGLDENNFEANSLLFRSLKQKDPERALRLGLKAYDLADSYDKRHIASALNYVFFFNPRNTSKEYIDFHLRYRKDFNEVENVGAKNIKLSLEFIENRETHYRDVEFNLVFANISDQPVQVFNHQSPTEDFFTFELSPELDFKSVQYSEHGQNFILNTGDEPQTVELAPGGNLKLSFRLSEIFSDPKMIPDGGYVLSVRYRGDWVKYSPRLLLPGYSDPVHFKITDYMKNIKN